MDPNTQLNTSYLLWPWQLTTERPSEEIDSELHPIVPAVVSWELNREPAVRLLYRKKKVVLWLIQEISVVAHNRSHDVRLPERRRNRYRAIEYSTGGYWLQD
jgi:hypothetical protein